MHLVWSLTQFLLYFVIYRVVCWVYCKNVVVSVRNIFDEVILVQGLNGHWNEIEDEPWLHHVCGTSKEI